MTWLSIPALYRWLATLAAAVTASVGMVYLIARLPHAVLTGAITGLASVAAGLLCISIAGHRRQASLLAEALRRQEDLERALTNRGHSEAAFQVMESQLRQAVEGAQDGLWDWPDVTRDEMRLSPRIYTLLGYTPWELPATISQMRIQLHPDDVEPTFTQISEHIAGRAPYDIEYRLQTKSGAYRWFRARGQVRRDEIGGQLRMTGTISDIQETHEARAALQESEARLRAIVDGAADGILLIDDQGWIESCNLAAEDMFGYSKKQLVGGNVRRLLNSCDDSSLPGMKAGFLSICLRKGLGGLETDGRRQSGETFPLEFSASEIRTAAGLKFALILRDMTLRKAAELALVEMHRKLQAVLDAATEVSIIATDPNGLITVFNRGAELMLGYRADEMVGRETPVRIHRPSEVAQRIRELTETLGRPVTEFDAFVAIAQREGAEIREWTYVRKDGSLLTVSLGVTTARDADGKITGYLGVAVDVTARNQAHEELQRNAARVEQARARIEEQASTLAAQAVDLRQAQVRSEAASRSKSEFLANMSHEIRTPLNGILGMTELALGTDLDAEQREYLDAARISAEHLLALINDILDLSKIEAGKLVLDPVEFNLRECFMEALAPFQPRAAAKRIELKLESAADLPERVVGDVVRLRQVLINLVGNAIKFTERGGVTVECRVDGECGGEQQLEVRVSDTGIGIPADKLETIFSPFEQADGSTTRRFGGTGLGLAIVSKLVALMDGSINVSSTSGVGSMFRFAVRLGRANPTCPSQPQPAARSAIVPDQNLAPLRPLRILVAEDQLVNQKFVTCLLQKRGHSVQIANNGQAAVEAFSNQSFDLILMDVQMPEMDGFEAARTIRDLEAGRERHMPIIAMTAHAMTGDRERCLASGMDDYVSKPIRTEQLFAAIRLAVQGYPPATENVSTEPAASDDPLFDLGPLLESVEGEWDVVRDLLQIVQQEAPRLLARMQAGVASGNHDQVERAAHQLKGSLGMLDARAAAAVALKIEMAGRHEDHAGAADGLARLIPLMEALLQELAQVREPAVPQSETR